MDHNLNKLEEVLDGLCLGGNVGVDYLLLPGTKVPQRPLIIDWKCITSVLFPCEEYSRDHVDCSLPNWIYTKSGVVCTCMIQNSLVCTPHNGTLYCITGLLGELNGNSLLSLRDGRALTYKKYYGERSVFFFPYPLCLHVINEPVFPKRKELNEVCKKKRTSSTLSVFYIIT